MRAISNALLLSVALAACAADPVIGPAQEETQLSISVVNGKKAWTIEAECQTTFNAPTLPPPAIHRQTDIGTCQFTPFGPMTVAGTQEINLAAGTQSGERTFTARNGDVLRAVHTGTSAPGAPGTVNFSATMTFVGGTGRFAGATGEARASGTATVATTSASFKLEGWLK
jgi:hypothetical protein